jgi:uncharacterized protein (DUF433 family)
MPWGRKSGSLCSGCGHDESAKGGSTILHGSTCVTTEAVEQAITRDPDVMHGTPVFRGTRVPVQTLFEYLEGGDTLEDFLEGFPTVSRELAIQALEEAKHLLLARI